MKKSILVLLLAVFLNGCHNSGEFDRLTDENAQLKIQIVEVQDAAREQTAKAALESERQREMAELMAAEAQKLKIELEELKKKCK